MEVSGNITGDQWTRERLREANEELGREFRSLAIQAERALAIELGKYTSPWGLMEKSADKPREQIKNEIMAIFPALEDGRVGAVRIYGLLEKINPKIAAAFWAAHKSGDIEAQEAILRKRVQGLARRVDKDAHRKLRKGGKRRAIALVKVGPRDNYIKRTQKTVGMAKAGWLHAAKGLGGRVRSGGGRANKAGAISGTKEKFPAFVRKAGARRTLGGASITGSKDRIRITLRNSVRHAGYALKLKSQMAAERNAEANFNQALRISASYLERSLNRKLSKGRRRAA